MRQTFYSQIRNRSNQVSVNSNLTNSNKKTRKNKLLSNYQTIYGYQIQSNQLKIPFN